MYPLLETIKVQDGRICHLAYHQERLENAFRTMFGFTAPWQLDQLIVVPEKFAGGLVKLRFLYGQADYRYEFAPYTPRSVYTLKSVRGDHINYALKYSDRSAIERLFEQRGECDDILIIRDGLVTDTSMANIIFLEGENWLTPSAPLLKGTCRARLLREGSIRQTSIRAVDLSRFSHFALINAMSADKFQPIPKENIHF